MSERQEHKKRYNLRLEYIAKFNKWLEAEPSIILFWKWRKWKNSRPIWRDIEKGGQIIKALEYCVEQGITSECEKCKFKKGCRTEMIDTALNLINRQKAEIEKCQVIMLKQEDLMQLLHKTRQETVDELQVAKAEIERLTEEVEIKSQKRANIFEISSAYERGRAKAITAYHEEVKKRCIEGGIFPVIVKNIMEDVRKEMVGE